VAAVIFSDFDSSPVPKCLNPDPKFFRTCESGSGYHRCNRNSATFSLKKWRT